MLVSERVWNLTRMLWAREVEGFGRAWDAPPWRIVHEPATGGETAGQFTAPEAAQQMLDYYYDLRGWDANGLPTRQTLERLGLSELVG